MTSVFFNCGSILVALLCTFAIDSMSISLEKWTVITSMFYALNSRPSVLLSRSYNALLLNLKIVFSTCVWQKIHFLSCVIPMYFSLSTIQLCPLHIFSWYTFSLDLIIKLCFVFVMYSKFVQVKLKKDKSHLTLKSLYMIT